MSNRKWGERNDGRSSNRIEMRYSRSWTISWRINWPSWWRSQALGNSERWSPISTRLNKSHRHPVSNPTMEYLVDRPGNEWNIGEFIGKLFVRLFVVDINFTLRRQQSQALSTHSDVTSGHSHHLSFRGEKSGEVSAENTNSR